MTTFDNLRSRLTLPYRRGAEVLVLALAPTNPVAAGAAVIEAYDFTEYRSRWGEHPAAPAYVITPLFDVIGDDLTLTIGFQWNGPKTVSVIIPQGTLAGIGFPLPLPQDVNAAITLRLTGLQVAPPPGPGDIASAAGWDIVALLGTLARLVWLLGVEKENLKRTRETVLAQRCVDSASGAGLDAIGADLRVARFPPRPYGIDANTVALYHLDDQVADGAIVADETTSLSSPGHPGTVAGANSGARGKYGGCFTFSGSGSAITVAPSGDFDVGSMGDATFEAFINANPGALPDAIPHAILSRRASESSSASLLPGWSLCVINARGLSSNVLFAACDGVTEVRCFADVSIADGAFHHVAASIDRARQRARLFIDGVQCATAPIAALGPIAPADGLKLGATAAGNFFSGSIDEVRISSVARANFHPALGESDDAYRARLRIFRRWVLPTPQRIIDLVNQAAPLGNDPAPYVLVEVNQPTQSAQCVLRIIAATLAVGFAIALDGSAAADESVAGTPFDDVGFDPAFDLITYSNAGVDTAGDSGGGRMQAVAGLRLDALAARLASNGTPGKLLLEQAFDVLGPTPLHTVGRALRLRHQSLATDALGAQAHAAGFDYVRNLGPDLAVAVAAGEALAIRSTPDLSGLFGRADAGLAFDLTLDPVLPIIGVFAWTIVTPGPASAHLAPHSADPVSLTTPLASRPRVRLVLDAPGDISVRAEYAYLGQIRSATCNLRIDPVLLADGEAIDASGNLAPNLPPNLPPNMAAIIGAPDAMFDPAYLLVHGVSAAIDFGANPDNARMQVAARNALDALVALLAARATPGRVIVEQAFVGAGAGVESVGRRLLLSHETLDIGVLGALAARFFDVVARSGTTVAAYVRPGAWIAIGDAVSTLPVPVEAGLGTPLKLAAVPATVPAGAFNWSTRAIGAGAGEFDTVLRPDAQLTPTHAGELLLTLIHVAQVDAQAAPYTFEIRLKPALELPSTVIPKPQYDIIMNVLDAFHPIGVEVRTSRLREHVREIEQDPSKAFPAYSFPDFRF